MIFIESDPAQPGRLRSSCPVETLGVQICDDILESRDCLLDGSNLLKLIVANRADATLERDDHLTAPLFQLNKGQAMVR